MANDNRKKSNEQTKRENALGTTGDTQRDEQKRDKGYSGSDDNQGGNSLEQGGTGVEGV